MSGSLNDKCNHCDDQRGQHHRRFWLFGKRMTCHRHTRDKHGYYHQCACLEFDEPEDPAIRATILELVAKR